ncbi:hypothetical protein QOT17_004237 [Balamuthia mandrillaris]
MARWTTYYLSPFRQRLFHGFFSTMLPRYTKKVKTNAPIVAPAFITGVYIYNWALSANKEYHRSHWY